MPRKEKQITCAVTEKIYNMMVEEAAEKDISVSELMRIIISFYFTLKTKKNQREQ
jgi:hypothetical protein